MNLFNPTEDVIEDRYLGIVHVIGPGQTKSVSDDCGNHMLRRKGCQGLVSIDYSPKEEEKYGSLKNFQRFKSIEGLKAYRAEIEKNLNQESMFPREVTQKNGGEVEMAATRVPFFKNKLKEIDALIDRASRETEPKHALEPAKLETASPAAAPKKRGRKPKGGVADVNASAA